MRSPIRLLAGTAVLAAVLVVLAVVTEIGRGSERSLSKGAATQEGSTLVAAAEAKARPGDILFKSGGRFWGRLGARFSSIDHTYGHVGIVVLTRDGTLGVIHAGGDPLSPEGRVLTDPLPFFLGASSAAALYRPRGSEDRISRLIDFAKEASDLAVPFDTSFSLASEDALYCTELVWRAFLYAGMGDPVPTKDTMAGKDYVALDSLQTSPLLDEVWRWSEG